MSHEGTETTWQVMKAILLWPLGRTPRHRLALLSCAIVTGNLVFQCLREGVNGWVSCDFAGQWMHGRAFFHGECDQLYTVDAGLRWLAEGYSGTHLKDMISDILKKGHDSKLPENGIEGPLYPPTAAMIFSFLAPYSPQIAHAVVLFLYLGMAYGCGWLVGRITQSRLQFAEASLIILVFPNNFMGLILGQNQMLTLSILTLGWYCLTRRLPFVAGLVWGLLAFKPVFAVAVILVPIFLPNLRMLVGMVLGGVLFVASTLPFTGGIDPWLRWLQVGQGGEEVYRVDRNWVWMSRDLVGLPRRKMWDSESFEIQWRYNVGVWQPGAQWTTADENGHTHWDPAVWLFWYDDFDKEKHQLVYVEDGPDKKKQSPWDVTVIGWCLLATVAALTAGIGWLTTHTPLHTDSTVTIGPRAVFLLTGALLCVVHFMHYDLLSFALPVVLFIDEALSWRRWKLAAALLWLTLWGCCAWSYYYGNGILRIPWETFLLLLLWAWIGYVAVRERYQLGKSGPAVNSSAAA